MAPKLPIPFLIDFDGVINLYNEPAPYAKLFFDFIENHKLPAFILSNSTLKTSKDVKDFLEKYELDTKIPIMTAADAALKYVQKNYQRISIYCIENVKKEFIRFLDDKNPQAVVIGDLAEGWSVKVLNEIFLKVKYGADLIAMHMNRYWSPGKDRFVLDAGSYISAIEYATEKKAVLIGKQSAIYYQTALKMLGYNNDTPFLMLGDDLELDITPAQKMGGRSILILTGKTKLPIPDSSSPDFITEDLAEVTGILKKIYSLD